ncbi:phage antirepressor KilAC domain-containing protein [Sporosarcina psychrophila]|uniref:Anti-repressor protein n=1 Tax=Sporosarcina psychrophila TaxID=1476 RepID=A0ABV2KCI7_SPOPS
MNKLQTFKSELFEIGVTLENGEVLFDVEQVARCLGITQEKNTKEYIRWERVNEYLPKNSPLVGKGDLIPEPMVYKLAFKASNELAEKFQDWLAIDVIPSIRKHGAYMTPDALEQAITNPDFAIGLLTNLKEEQNKRHEAEKVIEMQRPKVVYAEAVTVSEDTVLVKDLSMVLKQKGIDIGEVRLFKWMRENGYLCKQKGEMWNMPTQRSLDLGVFVVKHGLRTGSLGEMKKTRTPKITGKGEIYFINKFIGNEQLLNVK